VIDVLYGTLACISKQWGFLSTEELTSISSTQRSISSQRLLDLHGADHPFFADFSMIVEQVSQTGRVFE
jgi:hypothetical protein